MNQERVQEGTATFDGLAKPWLTCVQNGPSADPTDERLKAHRLKDQGKEASKSRGYSVCNDMCKNLLTKHSENDRMNSLISQHFDT